MLEDFKKEYPHFTESQIGGQAVYHYLEEAKAKGLDPRTLLPISKDHPEKKKPPDGRKITKTR